MRDLLVDGREIDPTIVPAAPSRSWGTPGDVADFDRVARLYRWMEYGSLGNLLERTRFHWLDAGVLHGRRNALVVGDGDGRFTARMMRGDRGVRVTAVDASTGMLALLRRRCRPFAERLRVCRCDAREYRLELPVDLVVTHFFLDCLTQGEVEEFVRRVTAQVDAGGLWVVSEFRVPDGWLKWPAWALVRGLYAAFRVLTGLKVTRLPEHGRVMRECGFRRVGEKRFLGGMLTSEVWELGPQ